MANPSNYNSTVKLQYKTPSEKLELKDSSTNLFSSPKILSEDFFTFNRSFDKKVKDLNIIKNILSKVPTNNAYEIYFQFEKNEFGKSDEFIRKLKNAMVANQTEGDLSELSTAFKEFFGDKNKNIVMKSTVFNISGLNQNLRTKEFTVLNQQWSVPSQMNFDAININFYDPIYQFYDNTSSKYLPNFFSLNQFFKIWMDNAFVIDNSGRILKTRMKYLQDFAIPRMYIIQYYPASGTRGDTKTPNNTYYDGFHLIDEGLPVPGGSRSLTGELPETVKHVKETVEEYYNKFTTTPADVFSEHKLQFINNPTLVAVVPLMKGALAALLKVASIGKLGFEIAEYATGIADEAQRGGDFGTDIFSDYITEYIKTYGNILRESEAYHRFSDNIKDRYASERANWEQIQKMTQDQFINFILNDDNIKRAMEEMLTSPEVLSLIGNIHTNMGVKYGIIQNTDFSKYSGEELKKLLDLLGNSNLIQTAGENKEKQEDITKAKVLLENLKKRLLEAWPDYENSLHYGKSKPAMNNGLVSVDGANTFSLYNRQKLEDLQKTLNRIYNAQETAKGFWNFNFGKGANSPDAYEKQYENFLQQTSTGMEVQNAQNYFLQYFSSITNDFIVPILGLVTAFYSMKDLGKTIVLPFTYLDSILNDPDMYGNYWEKEMKMLMGIDFATNPTKKSFAYSSMFFAYFLSKSMSQNKSTPYEKNERKYTEIINSDKVDSSIASSKFSGIMQKNAEGPEIVNVAVKVFTLYNVWPEGITFDTLSFEDASKKSTFNVKFRYTHMDESSTITISVPTSGV